MLPVALQLLAILTAVPLAVAAAVWGITADRSETSPAPSAPLLVAGDRPLFSVPTHNTHRIHGRHRAG